MEQVNVSWSHDEFKTYLLIYAAESNQIITEEEKEFIETQFDPIVIKTMQKEINSDNDYQRIRKIMTYIEQNSLSKEDLDELLADIHQLYLCDGTYDSAEQAIFQFLKKLFQSENISE